MRTLATALAMVVAAALAGLAAPAPARAAGHGAARSAGGQCGFVCQVSGLPGAAGYVGQIIIPAVGFQGPGGARASAAGCARCVWEVVPWCYHRGGAALCLGAVSSCPAGLLRMALYVQQPAAQAFTVVAAYCTGQAGVQPLSALAAGVRGRMVALLPPLAPRAWPPGGSLVNLPVLFAAGQSPGFAPVAVVAGYPVRLSARQVFGWTFGDGASQVTQSPGGAWPDTSVVHTYAQAGRYGVVVRAAWAATFQVAGLGPFAVTGPPVTQRAVLAVGVRSAVAVLVAG